VRLGIAVDGVHHWRAYSLTSEPHRPDGLIAITPKLVEQGKVSPFLNRHVQPGTIVRLGGVEGTFVLPDPTPQRLLFVTAGSGITPIAGMLRGLERAGELRDVVHVHCSREADGVIFADELSRLRREQGGYRLHLRLTGTHGRLSARDLQAICPDWQERETFLCGPSGLLQTLSEHWREHGLAERLHTEHFQPDARVGEGERGCGGTIHLSRSGLQAHSDGEQPILLAGEAAGAQMPFGCRMGICHSCVGKLCSGQVRDLRTGRVHGQAGEMLRTCINAPEGPVEIDL
jgi:ferredoxin-NADP reductase